MLKTINTEINLSDLIRSKVIERRLITRRILELEIMKLIQRCNSSIRITLAGKELIEAFNLAKPSPFINPWINTAVIYALELGKSTGYLPQDWVRFLQPRGLWYEGKITKAGEHILAIYRRIKPQLFLTPTIAEFLIALPPGPAPLDELLALIDAGGYSRNITDMLEAMRLLRIYPPSRIGSTYVLTPAGRVVKEALLKIPIYDSIIVINEHVTNLLLSKKLSEVNTKELGIMHLISKGEITEAGKELLKGYKCINEEAKPVTPFVISTNEVKVLDTIREFRIKNFNRVNPTYDDLRSKLNNINELTNLLHSLESKELVRRVEIEGRDTYELTKLGEVVLRRFKGLNRDITSSPVKAATYALAGKPPKPEWVKEGRELGIVFNDVTSRGYFILEVSKRIKRAPYLTIYDTNIVHKVPMKGITLEDLKSRVIEAVGGDESSFMNALSEAEGKGFIEVLPNDYVVLTEAGKLVKEVVVSASTQELLKAKVSITPTHYYVLKTIKDNITQYKKVLKESGPESASEISLVYNNVRRYTSITTEEVKKVLHQLRAYALLGKTGITSAGEALLKVGEAVASPKM